MSTQTNHDLLCFSHLRWNFVYQRPQHLIGRAVRRQRVFFIEEPVFHQGESCLEIRQDASEVVVAVPHLPHGISAEEQIAEQKRLLDELLGNQQVQRFHTWYYTPMALKFTRHLSPTVCIYDCMDQLSHFKGAPSDMAYLEQELMAQADVVFTGGASLFEAKCKEHDNIHAFPSSVDVSHFASARHVSAEPSDQLTIPRPRIGYLGVIDERLDIALVDAVAAARPEWQIIMVGPVVKIDPETLPRRPNIHYLGGKTYDQLPGYLASWDIAMLPFAHNDATLFISPTKTPEYLAAGCRVISTSVRDVVRQYGEAGLVAIADSPADFVARAEEFLALSPVAEAERLAAVDEFLSNLSWDKTWGAMAELIDAAHSRRQGSSVHRDRTVLDSYPAAAMRPNATMSRARV